MTAGRPTDAVRGAQLRQRILGPRWVANDPQDPDDPMTHFVAATLEVTWSGTWARPGLELRDRSIATIMLMLALGQAEELRLHFEAALRNGFLDAGELRELVLHAIPYLGFPLTRTGIRVLREVLAAAEPATVPPDVDGAAS